MYGSNARTYFSCPPRNLHRSQVEASSVKLPHSSQKFARGGRWRTLGYILLAVDAVSLLIVVGAIREFRKLDEKAKLD
jgi:hypothetical protein